MQDSTQSATDNFFNTWDLYQKIVGSNYMFHREIYADVTHILGAIGGGFSLLDLGCGDASQLAPVLAQLPITDYCGVDLSAKALELAEHNLRILPCTTRFHNIDLLQAVQTVEEQYDVIFTSFALHHLSLAQKESFFKAAFARIKNGGFLLMIDVVREENQDLDSYLTAYTSWLNDDWRGLNHEEKVIACQHIIENDYPETSATLEQLAKHSGFTACNTINQYRWHSVLVLTTS